MSYELTTKRTFNSKTTVLNTGEYSSEIHVSWVHYFDENGQWQDIDTNFREEKDYFVVDQSVFIAKAPKLSTGICQIEANNRYDVFKKSIIEDEPLILSIKALGVSEVEGKIEVGDLGFGQCNYIVYPLAYPDLNADLIYYVHYGRVPRIKKLIRFNSDPKLLDDTKISFEFTYDHEIIIEKTKDILTSKDIQEINSVKNDLIKSDNDKIIEISSLQKESWNQETKLITGDAIKQTMVGAKGKRGMGFKDFFIWDSNQEKFKQKKQKINIEYEKVNDKYIFTKVVPKDFFNQDIVYPVYTDASGDPIYPDPHTETTSVDGIAYHATAGTWASQVGGAGGGGGDTAASDAFVYYYADTGSTWNYLSRGFFLFDTSGILSSVTITSATLSLYGAAKGDALSSTPNANVYSSAPASNTAIVAGDFDSRGTTAFCDTSITYSGWNITGYNDFALNSSGIANITKEGISKFSALNANHDVANSAPTWSSGKDARLSCYFADETGTTKDPKLVVNYSLSTTTSTTTTSTSTTTTSTSTSTSTTSSTSSTTTSTSTSTSRTTTSTSTTSSTSTTTTSTSTSTSRTTTSTSTTSSTSTTTTSTSSSTSSSTTTTSTSTSTSTSSSTSTTTTSTSSSTSTTTTSTSTTSSTSTSSSTFTTTTSTSTSTSTSSSTSITTSTTTTIPRTFYVEKIWKGIEVEKIDLIIKTEII